MAGGGGGGGGLGPLNPRGLEMRKINGVPYYMRVRGTDYLDCTRLDASLFGLSALYLEQIPIEEDPDELPYARFVITDVTEDCDEYEFDAPISYYRNSEWLSGASKTACVFSSLNDYWELYNDWTAVSSGGSSGTIKILRSFTEGEETEYFVVPVIDNIVRAIAGVDQNEGLDAINKAPIDYCQDEKKNHICYLQEYDISGSLELVTEQAYGAKIEYQYDEEEEDYFWRTVENSQKAYIRYHETDPLEYPTQEELEDLNAFIFVGDYDDPLSNPYTQVEDPPDSGIWVDKWDEEDFEAYQRQVHHGWYKYVESHYWETAYYTGDVEPVESGKIINIYEDPDNDETIQKKDVFGAINPTEIPDVSEITRVAAHGSYIVCLDPEASDKIKVLWWQRPPDAFDWELAYSWGEARDKENRDHDVEYWRFEDPQSVAIDGTSIYILDEWENLETSEIEYYLKKYKKDGTYITRKRIPKKGKDLYITR